MIITRAMPPSKPPSPACRAASPQVRKSKPNFAEALLSGPGGPRFGGIRDTHSDGDLIGPSRQRRHANTTQARWLLDDREGGGTAANTPQATTVGTSWPTESDACWSALLRRQG